MDISYDFKPTFTLMTANLEPGESIKVEPGAMVAQSFDLSIKTGMGGGKGVGGFLKSMAKSMVGGESFWLNTFTAGSNGGWVSMAPSSPGDIETFDLAPGQKFIHAERGIHGLHIKCANRYQNFKVLNQYFLERVLSS